MNTGVTQAQKQALVDNLQLEITERARKLRAQYALQAQQLKSRLEMRVNRIPPSLRKKNMGELLDEHAKRAPPKPPAARAMVGNDRADNKKTLKRTSDHAFAAQDEDKENVPTVDEPEHLANPKKRTKTTKAAPTDIAVLANTKASRVKPVASNVLSPRSNNSRTLPKSPLKHASPEKTALRSIAAPSVVVMKPSQARAPSRTVSRQTSRSVRAPAGTKKNAGSGSDGRDSESSTTSAGTTIVTKSNNTASKRGAMTRKAPAKTAASQTRKGAAGAKKENVAPVASGRTLRTRT